MIHSGWIINSRWPYRQVCFVSLGSLSCTRVWRVTWVIGTTTRLGARQLGAMSNSVRRCATVVLPPWLSVLTVGWPSSQFTFFLCLIWPFVTSVPAANCFLVEMYLEGTKVFPGLMWVAVIFSGVGWLAMERNNFMMAVFSEKVNGNKF